MLEDQHRNNQVDNKDGLGNMTGLTTRNRSLRTWMMTLNRFLRNGTAKTWSTTMMELAMSGSGMTGWRTRTGPQVPGW